MSESDHNGENVSLRALEREIERLHQHLNRVLQAIGLVGGSFAIIVPVIAIFVGFRSDQTTERRLESFEKRIETRIEVVESRTGLTIAEPQIAVFSRDGAELSGKTVIASIVQQFPDKDEDQRACLDKDFDEYVLELEFLIKNSGQGLGEIDVIRIYHDGIFSDHEKIRNYEKYPYIKEWSKDELAIKVVPGGYVTPYYFWLESNTVDQSWCEPEDFKNALGQHSMAIQIFYRNQKGLSRSLIRDFTVLVVDN